jgi:hypothetical protein
MFCREKFIVSTRNEDAKKGNFQIVNQDVFSQTIPFFKKKIEARIILQKKQEGCKIYLFNHEEHTDNFIHFTDYVEDENVDE